MKQRIQSKLMWPSIEWALRNNRYYYTEIYALNCGINKISRKHKALGDSIHSYSIYKIFDHSL